MRVNRVFTNTMLKLAFVVTALLAWSEIYALPSEWKREVSSTGGRLNQISEKLSEGSSRVCDSQICQQDANEILESLDRSVDPCDDFYMFACGGWKEKHPATKLKPIQSHYKQFVKDVIDQGEIILEEPISEDDISPLKAAKKMYKVCMDVEKIERVGLQPLVDLSNELGGWPMAVEDWNEEDFILENNLVEIDRLLGWSPLIKTSKYFDNANESRIDLYMDEINIGLSRSELLDSKHEETREEYKQIIANVSLEIINSTGANLEEESIIRQASEIIEFMIQLKNISIEASNTEEITLEELLSTNGNFSVDHAYARFDWMNYLNKTLSDTNIVLDDSVSIFVHYINNLFELIKLFDRTPPRVLANYLQWRIIDSLKDATTKRMNDLTLNPEEELPRSTYCTKEMMKNFNHAINSKIVSNMFNAEYKEYFHVLVENIRSAFLNIISNNESFDDDSRALLKDRVKSMEAFSGYPDMYNNASALSDFYKQLNVSNEHFKNMVMLAPNVFKRSSQSFSNKLDKVDDIWETQRPEKTQATYSSQFNSILFTFGILQPYMFQHGRLESLNYGRVGVIAGHEIMHGVIMSFDEDVMDNTTLSMYSDKEKCFVEQYNKYHITELETNAESNVTVNGQHTLDENIGDYAGMYAAYEAYQAYVMRHGTEQKLAGLEQYSSDQMFFIGHATGWCHSRTSKSMEKYLTDFHAPPDSRVRGTVSNMEQFATAFNCPAGSNMNPGNKCRLW